jgi:predicted aspartyl protease
VATHTLSFSRIHGYGGRGESILIPIVLSVGNRRVALDASLDTGASACLFDRMFADELGLDVESGMRAVFTTANSRIEAFGHEVAIGTLGIDVHTIVYFFGDGAIKRNVLGRRGWLDRFRIGIVDHDQSLYLAGYDDEA